VCIQFEIRLCPALLHKPRLQTPHFEPADGGVGTGDEQEKKKHTDPFSSPYNPNLYVGELRDEGEGKEYVVLVSVITVHVVVVRRHVLLRSQD
jgi:sulfate adenylyltransferase (ADP) / ATP adenylyltransferase